MLLTVRQLRLIILESLTGRKLERVAKRIVYDIFEYLVDDDLRSAYSKQSKIGFIVDVRLPASLTWLRRVIVKMQHSEGFNSSARYEYDLNATDDQRKTSDLIVNLYMPADYTVQEISKFRYSIESDVRHELEHSGQDTDTLMAVQSTIKSEDDIWQTLDNAWAYYASPAELPAHIAGWVLKAKRSRTNVSDIVYQELYRIYSTGLDEGYSKEDMAKFMNRLSIIYYDYLEKRWPNLVNYDGE